MNRFMIAYRCLVLVLAISGATCTAPGQDNEGLQSLPLARLMSELRQDQQQAARDRQGRPDSDRLSVAIKQQAAPRRHDHWSALDSYYDTIGLRSRQQQPQYDGNAEVGQRPAAVAPRQSSIDDATSLINLLSLNGDRDEPKEFDRVSLVLSTSAPPQHKQQQQQQQSSGRSPFATGAATGGQVDQQWSDQRPSYRIYKNDGGGGGDSIAAPRKSDAIDNRFVPQRRGRMPPELSLILKHGHRVQPDQHQPSEYTAPANNKQQDDIKDLLVGRREPSAHQRRLMLPSIDLSNHCKTLPDHDYLANRDTFPSHLGLYRAKELASGHLDDSIEYLCGATLLGDRHALTLASCLRSHSPDQLFVQSNQWSTHELSEGDRISRLPLRQVRHRVRDIHIFPRFNTAAMDPQGHNLAIVSLKQPIIVNYGTNNNKAPRPACLLMSTQRPKLMASTCLAPVRNISEQEYFDPHGAGETKLKQIVQMSTASVKLIANNEPLCFNQTKRQYFNFVNPDYICSADYKTARWRTRLSLPENYGSGIYCDEGNGRYMLVSIVQPVVPNSLTAYGYLDLSYYSSWIVNVISGASFRR